MKLQSICKVSRALSTLVFFLGASQGEAQFQDSPTSEAFRICFYNLENLFHPSDDSLTNDEEFTTEGARHWTYFHYQRKINRMAKVILSAGEWDPPAIIGMEEVECREVVNDLIKSRVLNKFPYRPVHYESPDRRGIDVALIYRRDRFELLYSRPIPVKINGQPQYRTRDMLYVKGVAGGSDTLHLFVCHWPSRYGGQAVSEPKRIAASTALRRVVDSILENRLDAHIIIGGDFNDEAYNESLKQLVKHSSKQDTSGSTLTNLMEYMAPGTGSHRHHGVWTFLDHIVVSESLLNSVNPRINQHRAFVFRESFLLEEDEKYLGQKPYRHFLGYSYNGGFSDHLPVYVDLILSGDGEE